MILADHCRMLRWRAGLVLLVSAVSLSACDVMRGYTATASLSDAGQPGCLVAALERVPGVTITSADRRTDMSFGLVPEFGSIESVGEVTRFSYAGHAFLMQAQVENGAPAWVSIPGWNINQCPQAEWLAAYRAMSDAVFPRLVAACLPAGALEREMVGKCPVGE